MKLILDQLRIMYKTLDFSLPLAEQLDSLAQIQFMIAIEQIAGKQIDPMKFERENISLEMAIENAIQPE